MSDFRGKETIKWSQKFGQVFKLVLPAKRMASMAKMKKQHSPEFKLKAVIEILKGEKTATQIVGELGTHPLVLTDWKKQFLETGAQIVVGSTSLNTCPNFWDHFIQRNFNGERLWTCGYCGYAASTIGNDLSRVPHWSYCKNQTSKFCKKRDDF